MYRVALFDVDGVIAIPEANFSKIYAKRYNLDVSKFPAFFRGDFQKALVGEGDLKELVSKNNDIWQWEGSVDDLLHEWFETENVRNEKLLALIAKLRDRGLSCYFATNQEKYRGQYIADVMLKDEFDGYFISAQIGHKKPDVEFFYSVLDELKKLHPGIKTQNVIFFDDSPEHVEGAKEAGIDAHLFKGFDQVKALLASSLS